MKKPSRAESFVVNKVFTDREHWRNLFWIWYEKASKNLDDFFVLSYYGIGGIGKSSLVNQLCRELDEQSHRYVKYNFEYGKGIDPFSILSGIKQTIRNKYGKDFSFPLFNVACMMLAMKSDINFKNDDSFRNILQESPYLQTIVDSTAMIPLYGPAVQIGIKAISQIATDAANFVKKGLTEEQYKHELNIMSSLEADELRKQMPEYFAKDMYRNMEHTTEPLVIFLDTYEKYIDTFVSETNTALDSWLREGAHSIIQSIPGILWVISGRDKLSWENNGEWDEEHLRCERVGNLSEYHSRLYLTTAGIKDEELLNHIYTLSEGVPIYLELCVNTYYLIKNKGDIPSADNFPINKDNLINMYIKYMDTANQNLVYMLAAMRTWTDKEAKYVTKKIFGVQALNASRYKAMIQHSFIANDESGRRHIHNIVADALMLQIDKDFIQKVNALIFQYRVINLQKGPDLVQQINDAINAFSQIGQPDYYEGMYNDLKKLTENITNIRRSGLILDALEFSKKLNNAAEKWCQNTNYHAESLKTLGGTFYSNGNYSQALIYDQRSLFIRTKLLGDEHPETLSSLHNLGADYSNLGRYEESLKVFQKVYETRKRVLGEEHPDTLSSLHNLGAVYSNLGRYEESLKVFQKVYETRKRVLGEEHPDTLRNLHNVGVEYSNLGRYEESLEVKQKVYEAQKRVLGEEHPDTLSSLHSVGVDYSNLGRYEESLEVKQKVYEARKRVLGEEHPDTLSSLHNVGVEYNNLGRYEEALEVDRKVCETRKRVLGEEHPDTLRSLQNLGIVYSKLGRYEEALEVFQKVYEMRKRVLGEEHPETQEVLEIVMLVKILIVI